MRSEDNKKAVENEIAQGDVILEMIVDESKNDKYKLSLPLSYGVEFSEADGKGQIISTSSVTLRGTQTVIKTPGSPAKWALRVMKRVDRSSTDPDGKPVTIDGDGSGDGFGDWLMVKKEDLDENSRKVFQGARIARRTIILLQEEAPKNSDLETIK